MSDITKNVKDAAYVAIGLGVIGFQQAQVRRQELAKRLAEQRKVVDAQVGEARTQITKLAKDIEGRIEPVRETVDARLDELQARLPEQAKTLVAQARIAAKDAESTLRSRLTSAA